MFPLGWIVAFEERELRWTLDILQGYAWLCHLWKLDFLDGKERERERESLTGYRQDPPQANFHCWPPLIPLGSTVWSMKFSRCWSPTMIGSTPGGLSSSKASWASSTMLDPTFCILLCHMSPNLLQCPNAMCSTGCLLCEVSCQKFPCCMILEILWIIWYGKAWSTMHSDKSRDV